MCDEVKKIIIVLPNAFKFGWMGSTKRLFAITDSFVRKGYSVILLRRIQENDMQIQNIISRFQGEVISIDDDSEYPKFFNFNSLTKKFIRGLWRLFGEFYYNRKISYNWSECFNVQSFLDLHDFSNVNFIWGMSGGFLDSLNFSLRIAETLGIPFVSELHDPPIGADLHFTDSKIKKKFKAILDASTVIVTNSNYYLALIEKKYIIDSNKLQNIYMTYNTVHELYVDKANDPEFLDICYVGSLTGYRNLDILAHALNKLFTLNPLLKRKFRITIAGIGHGFELFLSLSEKFNYSNIVDFKGEIDSETAHILQSRADILLLMQPTENSLEIPGKLFQLMSYKKPILAILDRQSETANILNQSGVGYLVELNNIDNCLSQLLNIRELYSENAKLSPNDEFISLFTDLGLDSQIQKIIDRLN